eukprot:Gb_21931 [translate_table: standard]
MAKIGEDNGEIVAGTSPRSVLGSWEMGGHGQLQVNHNSSCSQNNDSDSESALNSETDLKYSATRYVIGDTTIEWSRDDPIHSFQRNAGSSRVRVHRTNRTSRRKFLKHNITSNSSHWSISRHLSSNIFACDENGRQKRQKQGRVTDPLLVFGSDVMLMILYRLDARSLAQSILVSHGWQALAGSDRLWAKKLEELWVGKAHLPRRALQRGLSKLAAYSISILDAKRTWIMEEDLCNHAWEFRFKTPVPLYWLNLDPSWRGTGPPMRRYFHPDGSQTADPTDKVWGGHECWYTIVRSFNDQRKIREHYVRINHWPSMSVSRKPNWGWELDNHVYCYSSIPDAGKVGGTGPLLPVW